MNLVPPGSDFDLYAGRDDSIRVERKELVNKRSETGMLNRREVEDRRYQLTLQNFRTGSVRIMVNDQLPVSRNAEIVVNPGAFSEKPSAIDKDSGKVSWEIELQPKAKRMIEFNYSVEWPKVRKSLAVIKAFVSVLSTSIDVHCSVALAGESSHLDRSHAFTNSAAKAPSRWSWIRHRGSWLLRN